MPVCASISRRSQRRNGASASRADACSMPRARHWASIIPIVSAFACAIFARSPVNHTFRSRNDPACRRPTRWSQTSAFPRRAPSGRHVEETLLTRLVRGLATTTLVPLHRIDRGTAGLVLFSANPDTRARYQALFRERTIVKHYEAVAAALPDLAFPCVRRSRIVPASRSSACAKSRAKRTARRTYH